MTISTWKGTPTEDSSYEGKVHPGRRMSEDEFVAWADAKTRAEWVDGEVIVMPPVSSGHDDLGFWLRSVVQDFVEHHGLGRVKGPEFMVRLPRQRRRRLPDVLFVEKAREEIILENHVEGAPDLIMEVVSPDSVDRDWREKFQEYEKAGVREYWLIDLVEQKIEAYALADGKFRRIPDMDGKVQSEVLKGFCLRPEWVIGRQPASRRAALREMGIP
jgi:Uma2 family endonuclease